jgi:hypothetical protein
MITPFAWTDAQLEVLHHYDALCAVCETAIWTQLSPRLHVQVCADCATYEPPDAEEDADA